VPVWFGWTGRLAPACARLLVEAGIDSISVTPDSFFAVKRTVANAEGHS
jgi:pyruvate,water dikinase